MELELGLKVTRTREDVSSSVDFRFSKDPFGPLVLSRETDSRFIIIIHLKGFKKEGIEIEINKEGNRISIRGRKPVEEIVIIRWMAWRKEVEFRTFKKVFLIPDIVDLDKIKARFDDDDSTLTITMPKRVKGISGFKLDEEEEENMDYGDASETRNREEVEEEFGEIVEDKERESRVFEGEEKGFSGGLDEEETQIEDDDLEKIQQIDEEDNILKLAEEETVAQEELSDMNAETEDSILRKLPDIIEEEDNQEVMEKQVETKSEGTESRPVEEIEEPEDLDRTSKSKELEKKRTDGDDDGLRKSQGIEEPERHNERKRVVAEDDIAETKTKAEDFESEKQTVGQQEFDGSNPEIEDSILRKLPDILEQENSQEVIEQKVSQVETKSDDNDEQEPDEGLDRTSDGGAMEKKSTDDDGDGLRKVHGIEEPEGHNEGSKIQDIVEGKGGEEKLKREIKNGDPKEALDAEMREGFTPDIERTILVGDNDIAETETKDEEFESGKPEADEVDKIHELVEKKKEEEEEKNAKIGTQSEDISLIKHKDIEEQQSKGHKPHEKREKIKELVEEKAPGKTINDAGSSKVQGIEEPEGHSEGSKIQDIIEGKGGGDKKKNIGKREIKNGDPGEDVDEKMGEGFTPNIERTGVVGEDDIVDTETKGEEFESGKPEADEVDKKHELVGKIEEGEENANVKDMVEEKTPEAETSTVNDVLKPVEEIEVPEVGTSGETCDEGKKEKEKKKSVRNRDAKEEAVGKMGVPNISETETKPAEFESEKLVADDADKIHELVDKKKDEEKEETDAKVGTQSEYIGLRKPQEIQEQQYQGQKRHNKQENIKELVEEQTPEAETNIGNKTPKRVQERSEGKGNIQKHFQEETKKQPEGNKGKMVETGKNINDAGSRKSQEIIRQQGLDEPERCEKESKPLERHDEEKEEKEIADTETKEQESYRPKILGEEEKVQEPAAEKTIFSKNRKFKEEEKIPERKTEFGDNQQKDSDAKEEVDAEMGEGFTPNISETETKSEDFEPHKLEPDEVHELVEKKQVEEDNAKVRRQSEDRSFIKLQEKEKQNSKKQERQEKTAEKETNILKPVQETEVPEVDMLGKTANEGEQGKEKQSVTMEMKNRHPKEEADEKNGKGFAENIAETETKSEEFESDKLDSDEVDEMHGPVEKKEVEEDNAKVRRQSEESSLVKKVQETEEQQFQGQKKHNKQENVKELLEEKHPEAEINLPQPVQVIEEPEVDTLETCGKEQDSYGPKTLVEQEKIQELPEEKMDFLKNGKVKEEGEFAEKQTEFGDDDHHISRKVGDNDQRDSDSKEEVDDEMGGGFTPNIAETEKKAGKIDKIHELVDKKKEKEEENNKMRKKSEDTSFKRLQEPKIQGQNQHNKQENIKDLVGERPEADTNNPKPVQETSKPEVETLETCEDKESAETETKDQESYRPCEDKIQELSEEKMQLSRKVEEEEKFAEKEAKFGDDDMSRKVRDIEQRGSYEMKGQEEKDKIQELVLEEKTSDGGKRIISEAAAENDNSRKAQETDKQQPHEEGKLGNQFQKVVGGEISGHGEVEDVESEKKTADSAKEAQATERAESDVSGKYGKGDLIQELEENRTSNQNEQEEEKEDEADGSEKAIGTIEQELVNQKTQVEQDNVEDGEETRKPVEDKTKEEESETKTDGVLRKVQGIKEHELFEPKRDHVSKIKEELEEKVAESEIEAECGGLRKVQGSEEQKLHKPDIHKESSKTKISRTEEPSGQEKEEEKIVESMTITEKENFTNVQEIKEEQADKPESHEKRYKIQELVEAEHNAHKEELKDEKLILKAKRETEEDSSKNVQEIEKQESDGLKRSRVQEKKQETKDKEITRAMKEKEIVERREKTEDSSLRKVKDGANLELSKPYKREEEDKVEEPVETGTSDFRKKVKTQDVNDILRSQEPGKPSLDEYERHSEQRNVPQLVDEENIENIAKPGVRLGDDDSAKFHEFEERKSYEDWTHDELAKIKYLVKEEATDPKDKHTGEEGHNDHKEEQQEEKVIAKAGLKNEEDSSEKVQEIERQEFDELQRSFVQDKAPETEEEDKTRAMEENEIVERRTKTKDGSLRKDQEGEEDPELGRHKTYEEEERIPELVEADTNDHREKVKKQDGDDILRPQETGKLDLSEPERHCKQRKNHQPVKDEKGEGTMENISEPGGTKEGDSSGKFHEFRKQKSYEDLVKEEANYLKDKHTGGKGEHEEERYEKVPQAKTKVEDEVNKKVGENRKEEENLVDDSATKIQETEKEESHESNIHEKLDMVQDFVEDKTGDQEDERGGEPAAVVANNEKDSSRNLHSIEREELKEPEEHKKQDEIPKTSDLKVKEADGDRVSEKETKEQEAHVQELEGKTENFKDDDVEASRGEKGKQGKTGETKSDNGISGMVGDTKIQESNETKNQEPEEKIGELINEDDSLRKGQDLLENESSKVSKRRPVEQEEIQRVKDVEKREDEETSVAETTSSAGKSKKLEMQELGESDENKDLKKIRKPMEEKTNAPEKEGSEKIAEVKMQDKIDSRMKDQETKRQEPYELLGNEEHGKIPEALVQGTKFQREEEKRVADREIENMKRIAEYVNSRKVQKTKAQESDVLEKQRKLSEIHENQSVEETIQDSGKEVNERGGYKAVLKTKSTEDSSPSQDVVGKRSDQTEQENIQGLMVEEEGKQEYDIREGEQNEKARRIPQVESKANDDNSKKNVTERLSGHKQNKDHQELVEMEKVNQRKEVREEKIVGKGETIDHEYKIQEIEEGNLDKHERHREQQRSGSLAEEETSNDKEENRGNRAGAEREIRDDGFEEEEELAQERLKKSFVEGKAKDNKNHETKSRDDSSRKTQENEKEESREQKRNYEEQDKKNLRPNYIRNEEDGKEDKQISKAEGLRELKGIENQDNINELVEEKTNNQEGEDKRSMSMEVLTKSEDHESKEPERLRKQDKSMEVLQQRLRDNLEDQETVKTETKTNDKESRKIHQIKSKETGEEERRIEQGRTKELVEDKTPEIDKEELTEPGRDEKPDEIEEPVDRETSEDDEEELEVEVEDSEEDWEAEVVQEMDSDEDDDKIRHIRRIKLGFRLVGGSTLFMSLIVIVISIIRSKRKIRCYKF